MTADLKCMVYKTHDYRIQMGLGRLSRLINVFVAVFLSIRIHFRRTLLSGISNIEILVFVSIMHLLR